MVYQGVVRERTVSPSAEVTMMTSTLDMDCKFFFSMAQMHAKSRFIARTLVLVGRAMLFYVHI